MNAHTTSSQVLSGTFKHGAGRLILLALGGTVVAAAVVTAVAFARRPEVTPARRQPRTRWCWRPAAPNTIR